MNTWCVLFTLINLSFTLHPFESILTFTFIASYHVFAGSMDARIRVTFIHIDLTVLTSDSWYANTPVPETEGSRWENLKYTSVLANCTHHTKWLSGHSWFLVTTGYDDPNWEICIVTCPHEWQALIKLHAVSSQCTIQCKTLQHCQDTINLGGKVRVKQKC